MSFPNGPAECIGNEKSTLSFNVSIILFLYTKCTSSPFTSLKDL